MKLPYSEGTWFGVPLPGGEYAVGIVARATPKGKVILCYFFGPRRGELPALHDVSKFRAHEALCALRVGDLHLLTKRWPVIGKAQDWRREQWPMPLFMRKDLLRPRTWIIEYSDTDPNEVTGMNSAPLDTEFEQDSLLGAEATEIHLEQMLR